MHSLEGAFSETLYVYAPCLEAAFSQNSPNILSMGLGLSYNEILCFGLALAQKRQDVTLVSFEKEDFLRVQFEQWLQEKSSDIASVYNDILQKTSQHLELDPFELKDTLSSAWQNQQLQLRSALPGKNETGRLFHGICYDAFSGGTDPKLWTETHFHQFISEYADKNHCTLTTYAATGALKRALRQADFKISPKEGFGMKRESTFAIRERTL
ncbi:MAG: MnmC family methyltransferase [Pseudomonadota bacterium]